MIPEVLLCGLAGWRAAALVTREAGPGNLFGRLRERLGAGAGVIIPDGSVGQLFSCVYCASIWTTAGAWLCWEYASPLPVGIMAAAGLAAIVERLGG